MSSPIDLDTSVSMDLAARRCTYFWFGGRSVGRLFDKRRKTSGSKGQVGDPGSLQGLF